MNIHLTAELEALVQRKVKSGLYNNQSEVVREALRLMEAQDRIRDTHLTYLRDALADGLAQADRGELLDGPSVIAQLRHSLKHHRDSDSV